MLAEQAPPMGQAPYTDQQMYFDPQADARQWTAPMPVAQAPLPQGFQYAPADQMVAAQDPNMQPQPDQQGMEDEQGRFFKVSDDGDGEAVVFNGHV